MPSTTTAAKTDGVNVRLSPPEREAIDEAARLVKTTPGAFVREVAVSSALGRLARAEGTTKEPVS